MGARDRQAQQRGGRRPVSLAGALRRAGLRRHRPAPPPVPPARADWRDVAPVGLLHLPLLSTSGHVAFREGLAAWQPAPLVTAGTRLLPRAVPLALGAGVLRGLLAPELPVSTVREGVYEGVYEGVRLPDPAGFRPGAAHAQEAYELHGPRPPGAPGDGEQPLAPGPVETTLRRRVSEVLASPPADGKGHRPVRPDRVPDVPRHRPAPAPPPQRPPGGHDRTGAALGTTGGPIRPQRPPDPADPLSSATHGHRRRVEHLGPLKGPRPHDTDLLPDTPGLPSPGTDRSFIFPWLPLPGTTPPRTAEHRPAESPPREADRPVTDTIVRRRPDDGERPTGTPGRHESPTPGPSPVTDPTPPSPAPFPRQAPPHRLRVGEPVAQVPATARPLAIPPPTIGRTGPPPAPGRTGPSPGPAKAAATPAIAPANAPPATPAASPAAPPGPTAAPDVSALAREVARRHAGLLAEAVLPAPGPAPLPWPPQPQPPPDGGRWGSTVPR